MRKTRQTLVLLLLLGLGCVSSSVVFAQQEQRILIGVNYFAGWWRALPNKWIGPDGKDWREKFPDRIPLLGEYNEQETMDREIACAAEYGVDFFQMLWYFNGIDNTEERGPNIRLLNVALDQFQKSPNADRMKFCIEYCNHEPFQIKKQADWDWAVQTWVDMMRHPSYLRVDGKPVFKVHSWHHFWFENDENYEQCQKRLEQLRTATRDAGLGEIMIGAGIGSLQAIISPEDRIAVLFDYTTTYMELPPDLPAREEGNHPFETLAEFNRSSRQAHKADAIPYLPYFGLNFNAEPWGDARARFEFPTKAQLAAEWERMKADLNDETLNLGFPISEKRRQKAFLIYAWNEFGEGGFLAPSRGEKNMKLETLRDMFRSN